MTKSHKVFSTTSLLLAFLAVAVSSTAPHPSQFSEFNNHQNQDENVNLKIDQNYRLPKSIVPEKYAIVYKKVTDTNFTGSVVITVRVVEETNIIAFHKGPKMVINKPNIHLAGSSETLLKNMLPYNETTEIEKMELIRPMKKDDKIIIEIDFDSPLRTDMTGFYRSTYLENGKEIWLAATQFEATSARHAFPCFDEPAFRAKFTVQIYKRGWPPGYGCLSNMDYQSDSSQMCEFAESVPMSTYLVAFAISDFKEKIAKRPQVPIVKVWTRKNLLDQAVYAGEIASKAIDVFANKLEEKYTLKKMDLIAVPDFAAGAMENWGLLTFREANLLHDEENTANVYKQRIASVVVHEVAHMWFGNLVTPEWWGYLWLSEAFARYYQYMATAEIERNWNMEQQFVIEQHQSALGIDALEDSKPMTRECASQSEIGGMGDTITYNKGASILRMIEQIIGNDAFNAALQSYMKKKRMGNASPSDLWQALQTEVNKLPENEKIDVAKYMKSWTEESGFPYIKVQIKPDQITLSQERFFIRNLANTKSNTTWYVPITSLSSSDTKPSTKPVFWLSKKQDQFANKNKDAKWLILNVDSTGFYRVFYDQASWQKIIDELTKGDFNKIPVLNRAAIVDDLLNFARADMIGYDFALSGLQYLKKETDYLPIKSAFTSLDYLIKKFAASPDWDIFKEHIISLISNLYNKLLSEDESKDDQVKALLRQEINSRACSLDHPDCIERSVKAFAEWKKNKKAIPKNQRATVYCIGIKKGVDEDFDFLWEKYKNSKLATEQLTILSAFGCSEHPAKIQKYLLNALNPNYNESFIRKQDISTVLSGVYSSSKSKAEFMLGFVETHAEVINKYYGSYDEIGTIVSGILQKYPTKRLISLVEKMSKTGKSYLKKLLPSFEKSIKLANFEMNWFNKHSSEILDWIKKNTKENTENYRLNNNINVQNYKLHIQPFFETFTFDGKVIITVQTEGKLKEIKLHTDQIHIKEVTVLTNENKNLTKSISYESKYNFTKIALLSETTDAQPLTITVVYTGYLNTEMKGFYRSSYDVNGKKRWLAATHLEPVGARRLFPCFDEPALKATFDITVVAPKGYHVISNTEQKAVKDNVYEFKTTPKMSTYLVAIVVSDFAFKSASNKKHTYKVYSNPLVQHQLDYSLSSLTSVVTALEDDLKHDYALNKLDMVALPDFSSGAMENYGLITYRESNMLYDSSITPLTTKQAIRNVIAHEVAHQWFGNLVSPLWWDYLWLNEGFARYFQYFAYSKAESTWNLEAQFVVDQLQTSFSTDALTSTHPITHKVYSPSEIKAIFDTISYAKAGSVIRMIEKSVGFNLFYESLNGYLKENKEGTGTPEKLFSSFAKKVNFTDIPKFWSNWTTQSGYPVVNVEIKGDTATLTQKRFFIKPKNDNSKLTSQTWYIPITYTSSVKPDFNQTLKPKIWLENKPLEIKVEKSNIGWVIFNLQQAGYYRVNYDKMSWVSIIAGLVSDSYIRIHEINRAAIIDDLLNLARAGQQDYDLVFAALRYLSRETEYAPWKAAYNGLAYLNQRFSGRPVIYNAFRTYLLEILEPVFKRLGFDDKTTDRHTDQLLRKLVLEWMCSLNEERCVNKAVQLLRNQRSSSKLVPANQQSFVYCTAIRHGGDEEYKYLKEKFQKSIYSTERLTILAALGCSQNQANLLQLLESVIKDNSEIRLQDAQKVFTNVIEGGAVGIETTLLFLEKNHIAMKNYFGDDSMTKTVVSSIAKRVTNPQLFEKFEKFIDYASVEIESIGKSLQTSLNNAKYDVKWYTDKSLTFSKLINTYSDNKTGSSYRLPKIAEPISYDVYLTPYFDPKFKFDGRVIIKINVIQETHYITLNQHKLKNIKVSLPGNAVSSDIKYNETTQQFTVYFEKPLEAKKEISLTIEYEGELRNDMRGFYRSSYEDEKKNTKWIASTQFEPTYARSAFPCFDEPSFKATFKINIAAPKGYHTLSNMGSKPTKKAHESIKDYEWHMYEESKKMSSYLVAFVVSDFEKTQEKDSSVAVWSRKELTKYCNYASKAGDAALKYLGSILNYPYVLKEMNFVSVPDFDMGAMENWGLVTYREYGLSYDLDIISATYRRYVNTVISHELVHMWFGNLVTLEWWDYTWLNEGFAEYLSYIVSDKSEPTWELLKQFVTNEMHVALDVDAAESSHPMNNNVLKPNDIQDGFDKIAYQKSASVLRMFHQTFGDKAFFEILQAYMKSNDYRNANPKQLIAEFQKYSEKHQLVPGNPKVDVTTIMNSWITQAGYPVVTADRQKDTVHFKQERFLISSNNASAKNVIYWIPITYATKVHSNFNDKTPKYWLGKDTIAQQIETDSEWYIVNVQQVGYYRVNYDIDNWKALIKVLNSDQYSTINDINRAQLIDDSLNLARADYIKYDVALNVTKYLSKETNYYSWRAFFNAAAYLSQRIEGDSEMKKLYQNYVLSLLSTAYDKLKFEEDTKNDADLDQLTRELILTYACKYGHEDCIKQAKEHFKKESITPNIALAVYCTAIENGAAEDWDKLYNKYTNALLASDYITMLKGLGCSKDPKKLNQYLDYAFDPKMKIRRQDLATVLSSVYTSSEVGLMTAIEYFQKNAKKLHDYFGNWEDVGSLFTSLAGRISTKSQIATLQKSINEKGELSEIKSYLDSAVKTAEKNLNWFEKHSKDIQTWLTNNNKKDSNGAATLELQFVK